MDICCLSGVSAPDPLFPAYPLLSTECFLGKDLPLPKDWIFPPPHTRQMHDLGKGQWDVFMLILTPKIMTLAREDSWRAASPQQHQS